MKTSSQTFTRTATILPGSQNRSFIAFEEAYEFNCLINSQALMGRIVAHEVLFFQFGLWVSFNDGNTFLMYTDSIEGNWVSESIQGSVYANAIQNELDHFFENHYDKLSTYSW
jgi:hypothetical protein